MVGECDHFKAMGQVWGGGGRAQLLLNAGWALGGAEYTSLVSYPLAPLKLPSLSLSLSLSLFLSLPLVHPPHTRSPLLPQVHPKQACFILCSEPCK